MTLTFDAQLRLGRFEYNAAFEADQEIVVLFGHSGAGKSVTLQAIAGLVTPHAGRIEVAGRVVFDSAARVNLPAQQRGVGYVVQELALFPHMTVADNVAFGLEGAKRDRHAQIRPLLSRLGLDGFEERMPGTLSGGQRQRVALGRALARDVPLLLLDEPFSALDESLRRLLRAELLRLRAELGLTVVFVTHDLREAHLLADRLAVFDGGRILQFDRRDEVFRHPRSRRIAELVGVANVLGGRVIGHRPDGVTVEVDGVALLATTDQRPAVGSEVDLAIRAERVNLRRGTVADTDGVNLLEAEIVEEHAYGATHTLWLEPAGAGPRIEVEVPSRPYEVLGVAGKRSWLLELPPDDLHVMARAPEFG